jgi:hypothetical protein
MDSRAVLWQKLKLLLQDYNFVVEADFPVPVGMEEFLACLEMLILLGKVSVKRKLSSRIYLAMLHHRNRKAVRLVKPHRWKLRFLILSGRLLGFRI